MVDGLHIPIMKQDNESSCHCFKWGEKGSEGERLWGNLTNVQYKPVWNCYNESPCTRNTS
jgi:hypothetical protein